MILLQYGAQHNRRTRNCDAGKSGIAELAFHLFFVSVDFFQEFGESSITLLGFQLTLPHQQDFPSRFSQLAIVLIVTINIAKDFFFPECSIALGPDKVFAAVVTMPEAAVHKYNCFVFRQHNVWRTGETLIIFSIAISFGKKKFTDKFFWLPP